MKTPLFMDKGVLAEDLSTKSIDSMDKEHFRRELSMKTPDFMDRQEKRLSRMKGEMAT
jgi:hypothetical protein